MKKFTVFKEFGIITLATALLATSFYIFMVPSQVSVGSVSGLAMIISQMTGGLPISVISLVINAVLLVIGFIFLGTGFGIKTVYTSILLPLFLGVLEFLYPNPQPIIGDPFQDILCHLFLVSIAQAAMFNQNASSGGLDIIGKLLNKYLRIDLGKAVASTGLVVAALSFFVSYDLKIAALSILSTYLNGLILDHFIFGSNIKRRVCILSSKVEEIRSYVISDLNSGATIYDAIGAYHNTPLKEIVVIVNKHEYAALMRYVTKTDPAAFVTVYNVNEVAYVPKPPKPRP